MPRCKYNPSYQYYGINRIIDEHFILAKSFKYKGCDEDERKSAQIYKKSVTLTKLRDLYYYGFEQAKKLVPDSKENVEILQSFWQFWIEFTKNNNAEDLFNAGAKYIKIDLFHDENEAISWEAALIMVDREIKINNSFNIVDEIYEFELVSE